jgi:hypothetical protein
MKKSSKTILATFLNIPLIPILLLNSISGFILAAIVPLTKSIVIAMQINIKTYTALYSGSATKRSKKSNNAKTTYLLSDNLFTLLFQRINQV